MPDTPEPTILKIDPGTGNHRLSQLHDALRDMGLELCSSCGIWKPVCRMVAAHHRFVDSAHNFTSSRCTDCVRPAAESGQ